MGHKGQAEAMLNSEKIKPVALAIVELYGISQVVSQSVENKSSLATFCKRFGSN